MNNTPIRLAWTDFVLDLQDLLLEKGIDTPLYIVGGAVRDAYRRGAIKDIDIAVDGDAIRIARKVTDWFNGDIFVMDEERGVARVFVTTVDESVIIDFANFRSETLEKDLEDRDFTINAMAADLLGDVSALIDPLNGEQDLNQKVLRRCTEQSLQDDPIRVLRAIRQSVQLGLKIHPDTLEDIRVNVSGITESSFERVRDEFYKILDSANPSRAIRVLQHLGVLRHVIANADKLVGLEQSLPHRFDVWSHTLLVVQRMSSIMTAISYRRTDNTAANFDLGMLVIQFDRYRARLVSHINREYGNGRSHRSLMILAALIHNLGKVSSIEEHITYSKQEADTIAQSLRLTNDEHKRLLSVITTYRDVLNTSDWSTLALHRFWFKLGENGIDTILLATADYLGMVGAELEQAIWLEYVERVTILLDTYFNHYDTVVNPPLYLNGNEIMELLDVSGGPVVGHLLTMLREAQVTGDVTSSAEARDFIKNEFDLR